jgi:predicted MPP superfamily phosphohydrolase
MRIVHISDFHWSPEDANNQKLIVAALLRDLEGITSENKPDCLIFSGDLVKAGQNGNHFFDAWAALIEPLESCTGVAPDRFFIVPGNHDVSKKEAEEDIITETGLRHVLNNRDALNEHIDRIVKNNSNPAAARLNNYYSFVRKKTATHNHMTQNLLSTARLDVNSVQFGFALLNTAWRSRGAGEEERHEILLGERTVDLALSAIDDCDVRIAVLHHPLEWLAIWDRRAAEVPLLDRFDLLLCGHIHEAAPLFLRNRIGTCVIGQAGCLYEHRDYKNSYNIVDIDVADAKVSFNIRTYFDRARGFGPGEDIAPGGLLEFPLGGFREDERLTRSELRELQTIIEERADAHVCAMFASDKIHFDNVFSEPSIAAHPAEDLMHLSPVDFKKASVAFEEIAKRRGVSIIIGGRQTGKTVLSLQAARIAISDSNSQPRIPVLVDFAEIKPYSTLEDLVRQFRRFMSITVPVNKLTSNRLQFIVDNVIVATDQQLHALRQLVLTSKDVHDWLLLVDAADLFTTTNIVKTLSERATIYYVQELNRAQIRQLAERVSATRFAIADAGETALDLIARNGLPKTHYIVTLAVFAMAARRTGEEINEATLVENLVAVMLEKGAVENIFRSSTDFRGLSILLENIADWLDRAEGPLTENDLLAKVAKFYTDRGIGAGAAEVVYKFFDAGILVRSPPEVGFRFRAVGSFFLASFAKTHPEKLTHFLANHKVLRYFSEIAFLTDMNREDPSLLPSLEEFAAKYRPAEFGRIESAEFLLRPKRLENDEIVESRFESLMEGPRSPQEIDESADFADRAIRYAIHQAVEDAKSDTELRNTIKEDAEKAFNLACYLATWLSWAGSLFSLDFVTLDIRGPSIQKLLTEWARICGYMAAGGVDAIADMKRRADGGGKPLSESQRANFEYMMRVETPIGLLRRGFSRFGRSTLRETILDAFKKGDRATAEFVGLAILLILHRPSGWSGEIRSYAANMPSGAQKRAVIELLTETCLTEYRTKVLLSVERGLFEDLVTDLIIQSGISPNKRTFLLSRIRQGRAQAELLASERN